MTIFDQQNQTVTYQTNIAMNNAVEGISSREDLLRTIEMLRQDAMKAYASDALALENWTEAKQGLESAKAEAESPKPDGSKLVGYLDAAKNSVKDVVAVAGLYEGVTKLIEMTHHLQFLS